MENVKRISRRGTNLLFVLARIVKQIYQRVSEARHLNRLLRGRKSNDTKFSRYNWLSIELIFVRTTLVNL